MTTLEQEYKYYVKECRENGEKPMTMTEWLEYVALYDYTDS